MKKVLILLITIGILASCNNNQKAKGGGLFGGLRGKKTDNNTTRNKDDDNINNTNDRDDDGNAGGNSRTWAKADRNGFLQSCTQYFQGDKRLAGQTCACVLEKLEAQYASLAEAESYGGSNAGAQARRLCDEEMQSGNVGDYKVPVEEDRGAIRGRWTNANRQEWVYACVESTVNGGATDEQAQAYCSCLQQKIERIYPSYGEAIEITEEDLQSPQLQKILNECSGGGGY